MLYIYSLMNNKLANHAVYQVNIIARTRVTSLGPHMCDTVLLHPSMQLHVLLGVFQERCVMSAS